MAVLSLLLQDIGSSQLKFFENGQQTRQGTDAALFPQTPSRMKIDLSGPWRYSTNDKEWNTVSIPSAYDAVKKVTFIRTFGIRPEWLDRYMFFLVAYGINYQSEITINGNFIGRHTGGYSSFVLPIPQNVLQVGTENAIKITVDNELTPSTTLPVRQNVGGWRTYGGIFRDIYLLAAPRLYLEQPRVISAPSADGKSAVITVGCEITERGSGLKAEQASPIGIQFELYDKLTNELVLRSSVVPFTPLPNKSVEVTVKANLNAPKLWSPELPDLYVVKCMIVRPQGIGAVVLDEVDIDIGVRELRWSDNHPYVNNILTPLKGVIWQEDHPAYGSAMTYAVMERDIALMKTLGANLVRFLHPPHPYLLNLCDRYGIMVMEEIPLIGVPKDILLQEHFQDLAVNYIKEMVNRDRNHASLLAWGIGDEFESQSPNVCEYVNTARNIVRSLDDRAVYYASNTPNDQCYEYADLVSANIYTSDIKQFRDVLKKFQAQFPGKPIVVARYGISIEPGNRNGYSDLRSLDSQARTLMQCYDATKDLKIAGSVIWSFGDWRSDRPALTTHSTDPYLQTMGLVSYDREKRVSFEVVRTFFNGEKVQALPIGNYASGAPVVYVLAGLFILISFAFLYNSNRRFRDCVNRSLFRTYNFFADIRDQHVITYTHSFFLTIVIAVTWATIFSSMMSHYRENLLLDNMLNQFLADSIKSWFVKLIWSPPQFILTMSVLIIVKIFIVTVMVQLLSMTVRTHVYFYHAFSITVWSMLPYIFLIPLSMILYRMMESEVYIVPVFVLLLIMIVWVVLRLLKGISIIYDVISLKVYTAGILLTIVVAAGLYSYFEYTRSTSMYVRYMLQNFQSLM